jgi:hypothetical protein
MSEDNGPVSPDASFTAKTVIATVGISEIKVQLKSNAPEHPWQESMALRNASGQYHLAVPFFDSTILASAFGHY